MCFPPKIHFNKDLFNRPISSLIIRHLSQEWPLTAKVIHNRIKRYKPVSLQGIHKCLIELSDQNILIKSDKEYFLSVIWLESLINFGASVKKAYVNKEQIKEKFSVLKGQWK